MTKADLSAHVRERLEKELIDKERARKEKEESHLYTIIKVVRDSDMRAQIGQDIFFDLANHDKACPVSPGFPSLADSVFLRQFIALRTGMQAIWALILSTYRRLV